MTEIIEIAAAAIVNRENQMLLVRKRGTSAFMQPGGKIDAGETAREALIRELEEELALTIRESALTFLGTFEEVAANEEDASVKAEVFKFEHDGPFQPKAEIEEILWYPQDFNENSVLAPLSRNKIIPASGI